MRIKLLIVSLIIIILPVLSFANGEEEEKKEFNTVEFIFDHVNDSHEWHFFGIGEREFTIPLPVILYSKISGWHFFSSAKLHHPQENSQFALIHGGPNDRKIVELTPDGSQFVPLDLSITKTVLASMIAAIVLILFLINVAKQTVTNPLKPPRKLQNLLEPIVLFIRDDIAVPFIGKKHDKYLPFLLTLFSFILITNLLGLILPLGINITGNIAVTMVLAMFTFIITNISAKKHYWLHIINPDVPWFMKVPVPLVPFIEILGIFIKPIVLMIRLFANMFAGHMIVTVLVALIFLMSSIFNPIVGFGTSLISIPFSVFMMLVDVLVSFIQAYIFTLLSAMYFGMATEESGH